MSRSMAKRVAVLSLACLGLAIVLVATPVEPSLDPVSTDGGTIAFQSPPAIPVSDWDRGPYWQVVEGNILSRSRQSPEPGGDPWVLPSDAIVRLPPSPERTPGPRPRYRLSGIVLAPDGPLALIDADPSIPGAEIYRVGGAVGPYRLTEATDSTVTLVGPSGGLVLRLESN